MKTRIALRAPTAQDSAEFITGMTVSRALHHPWTSGPQTPEAFQSYLEKMSQEANCALLACHSDGGQIAGVFNITNIVRGPLQSAYLGYSAFLPYAGKGLMKEGLRLTVRHAFKVLNLHRLEANIQPGNAPSIGLVKACGFALEGYSPHYLKIRGRWKDHERWAILA